MLTERIARLCGPPAIHVHTGVVALELWDGASALATRPAGLDPVVFVRAGGPAPGVPDQHIARLGPPVTNSGVPDGPICGVASVARLSGGKNALWLGAFVDQISMTGAAIVPLVAGERTDCEPGLVVDEFTPVKLSNAGSLLLRVDDGLLLLDRLFDWYDQELRFAAAPHL